MKDYSLLQRISYVIVLSCCLLTFSHGLSVLLGKEFPHALITQANLMTYDAAISFCIGSAGLVAIIYQRIFFTFIVAIFLILISMLTITQYVINAEWDMTRQLLSPFVELAAGQPGRMRPITPFCFLLFAITLLYLIYETKRPHKKLILVSIQGIIILCLALIFLFGYTWNNSITLMTSNSSIGFILLSLAVFFTVIYLDKGRPHQFSKSMPMLISGFITVFSLLSFRFFKFSELIKQIDWFSTVHEMILSILIGVAIYFVQRNYLYAKSFKNLYAKTKATLESAHDGLLVINSRGQIVDYNQRLLKLWSISSDDLLHKNFKFFFDFIMQQLKTADGNTPLKLEFKKNLENSSTCELNLKNGKTFEFYSYSQRSGNKTIGYVFSFYDITHLKLAEENLRYHATHDVLTKLANRFLLFDHIEQAIAHSKRENKIFAILFLDLDCFKLINDSLSHLVGDQVLKAVASRLLSCTRAEDTLSRIGGDEFILLAVDLKTQEDAALIANKYLQVLAPPFYIERHELYIRCSIGISLYPEDGEDSNNMVKNADIAMYLAKHNQDHVQFYTKSMHDKITSRLKLENELPRALENNQLEVYYQPIIDLRSNKICDTEALLRWNHPTRGLLTPAEFITAAEETGIINEMGKWVLKTVCQQNKYWQDNNILTAIMSVNISLKQLQQIDFVDQIATLLAAAGLDPKYLQLELTENRLIEDIDYINAVLNRLKKLGIKIAIDDFGTGYSGLSYIKYFPLDKLKIDKSLIKNIPHNLVEKALVDTLINMCKNLHINSCVEGVETQEQYQYLHEQYCNEAQGFYFSHPLSAKDYERFVIQFSA